MGRYEIFDYETGRGKKEYKVIKVDDFTGQLLSQYHKVYKTREGAEREMDKKIKKQLWG